ncbi:MAG: right-handed parallel beta-helix repeat-containing protein [Armatimonadetes bacterium]|nr:right-handed parallel beta-helix repeat-containing protein [Armatimonadota bacterium]
MEHALLAVLATASIAVAAPTYPSAVYPTPREPIARRTEVPYTETEPSRRLGYNMPFPDVARTAFRVEDYGAVADGVTDCTPAFYQALAAAKASGQPAELVFSSSGRYFLLPHAELGSDDQSILNARGLDNAVIRGQGFATQLVAGEPKLGCLMVSDSRGVMVRDLAIDYNPLPFTQGTVTEVKPDDGYFTLRLHDGYSTPAELAAAVPGNHAGYVMYKAAGCRWPSITPLFIAKTVRVEGTVWRFEADPKALKGYLAAGDDFVYVGRRIAQQALSAGFVRGFQVSRVTVHASPTCGFGLWNVDGALIDGYADCPPPGSDRLLASNADGLFVHGERGGITVRGSYFMGQGDDCINLHCPGLPGSAVKLTGDRDIEFRTELDLRRFDVIEVMNPATNQLKGQAIVESVQPRQTGVTRCRLTKKLADLGYDATTDELYPVNLSASNFKIVDNYFGQNRSRCLLIQARDGLIAGNTAENAEGYGVILGYGGTAWHEGVMPANVTIAGNLFRNVTNRGMAGVIEANGGRSRLLRNLTVSGNRFENPRKMVLAVSGIAGLTVTDNAAATEAGHRMTWNHPEWYPVDCSLYLVNCAEVVVDSYRLRDPDLKDAGIHIGKDCAAGTGVTVRGVTAELAAGVPTVQDRR